MQKDAQSSRRNYSVLSVEEFSVLSELEGSLVVRRVFLRQSAHGLHKENEGAILCKWKICTSFQKARLKSINLFKIF